MSMKIYNLTINLVIIADIYICHKVVKALEFDLYNLFSV